ncbi:LAMI_0H10990g1_1 [Lachancea mirantina]|uniref:MICOS complex subunit MIC12 n=1 Tax=Lachancea mirantina TaxID=1230905 RepID=A0A1G4KGW2_9SACH|nr:LAMI_0H10990g1_1 [Lachancea mirantina]
MSKLLKLSSTAFLASVLTSSYYFYAVDRDGYHYQNSSWKRMSDYVQGVIDRREDIVGATSSDKPHDVVIRPFGETVKDLWNQQVRDVASWVYSWS